MKKRNLLFSLMLLLCLQFASACSSKTIVLKPKPAPPGQVKKQTGAKSAKAYAPGQVKKQAGSKSANTVSPGNSKKKQ